jgi:hypothetical protein
MQIFEVAAQVRPGPASMHDVLRLAERDVQHGPSDLDRLDRAETVGPELAQDRVPAVAVDGRGGALRFRSWLLVPREPDDEVHPTPGG